MTAAGKLQPVTSKSDRLLGPGAAVTGLGKRLGLVLAVLGAAGLAGAAVPARATALAVNPGPHRLTAKEGAHELLLVDVFINGRHLGEVAAVERSPGGALLLPVAIWTEARLAPLTKVSALADGTPAFSLDDVRGLTYTVNRQRLALEIAAPANAFVGSTLSATGRRAVAPARPHPGVMLNYDLSASRGYGSRSGGATLELTAFSNLGSFVSSALVLRSDQVSSATRLDSYWRRDLPERMQTLVLGDAVGVGGGWSRPARYGGVRWGTEFGMQSGVVTQPPITLAGEAALPSTVEVLVNNARLLSQPVQPGPFELHNVPVVTGSGELNLVVRDLLGRETVVTQRYYMAPRLLARGLRDFSFEAGWLRTGYGRDTAYGDGFGSVTWRQGVSDRLTGEGRVELQRGRQAAGAELTGVMGTWGAGRMALAAASGDRQGQVERGHLLKLGLERSTPTGGGTLQYEQASQGFAPFGEALGAASAAQRARERWLASLSGSFGRSGLGGGVSFVQQKRWDGERVQALGLGARVALWQRASLSMSLNKRLDSERAWSAGITVSLPLENGIYTALRMARSTAGSQGGAVSASYSPTGELGVGWNAEASVQQSASASAGMQGKTSRGDWSLDLVSNARGLVAARAGGRGTLGWLAGIPFATRSVGNGSFVVVEVGALDDKLEGVPVRFSHQLVGKTDSRGLALVTGLLPWQQNRIEIDMLDLPLDVEMDQTVQQVTPYARSGSLVSFAARRTRHALVVLHQLGGEPVPSGAYVQLLPGKPEFRVGRRGEVWLMNLTADRQPLQVRWPGGFCQLVLTDIPTNGSNEKIGPLPCTKEPK